MKRNKPIVKRRKAGTQMQRRSAYRFDDQSTGYWALAVRQSFVGVRENVLDMTGAVPAGDFSDLPEDPRMRGGLLRWRLQRDGQTEYVYGRQQWSRGGGFGRDNLPLSPDVFHVFTASRRACTRGSRCPLTSYLLSDSDIEVPRHHPDRCPMSVLDDGTPWRLAGRVVPDGAFIC
ncbi:hypothetical protein AB0952_09465 [Streptomyces caniferus]|uniref:hypothetical protein n=1 Tax=Streptomyces caniferus TaxID=285557 RepID=UPI00345273E1